MIIRNLSALNFLIKILTKTLIIGMHTEIIDKSINKARIVPLNQPAALAL